MTLKPSLYPLLLDPSLHIKVWGGRRLGEMMDKPLPTDDPYGESWELHDTSTVANGELMGQSIGDLVRDYGADLIGKGNDPSEGFPLLAKFLDASDWLSIQVHPNDEQAEQLEGQPRGKTEAWIILGAEPDAQLVVGVKSGTTREAMAQAIRENTLEDMVVYADVNVGDVLYLKANTVHALGPGLLIYEIQQSSDTTYRLYDWGRMGLDGTPRELHIDKGVQVSNLESLPKIEHPGNDDTPVTYLVNGEFFITARYQLDDSLRPAPELDTQGRQFHAITCIDGDVMITSVDTEIELPKGRTALIPASVGIYTLHGKGTVLRSWQAD